MKLQEKLKRNINPKGLYNLRYIEKNTGLRKLKLYSFLKGKEKLTDSEALSVLSFIKTESKLKK